MANKVNLDDMLKCIVTDTSDKPKGLHSEKHDAFIVTDGPDKPKDLPAHQQEEKSKDEKQ